MKEMNQETLCDISVGVIGGGRDPSQLEVGATGRGDDSSYNGGDAYSGHCGGPWSDFDDAMNNGNFIITVVTTTIPGLVGGKIMETIGDALTDKAPTCPSNAVSNPHPGA